tara:strand:- start:86 stop:283 length:198 start_codon:yes stop_codon:yes gene_type:complete
MINNNNTQDADIFRLDSRKDSMLIFPYKKIVNKDSTGTLNIFQRSSLSQAQKDKIKEDLKKLGGS